MIKRLLSLFSLLLISLITPPLSAAQNTQALSIELIGKGQTLQFKQKKRLEQVLKLAQERQVILQYPLAVTLFDNSTLALQKTTVLKNSVLNQMVQYNLAGHPLYKFIQQNHFAPRVMSGIDFDAIRLDKRKNPLLAGNFALSAPLRKEMVLYLGNIDGIYTVKNQAGVALDNQLVSLQKTINSDSKQPPILIYPDGNIARPQYGSWLNSKYYLPPLTIVYFPFEGFEGSQMDRDIIKLLSQRRPTSSKND